jgi:hypothetical protein
VTKTTKRQKPISGEGGPVARPVMRLATAIAFDRFEWERVSSVLMCLGDYRRDKLLVECVLWCINLAAITLKHRLG